MSMPDYVKTFTWDQNIERLASKLESVLRERAKTRATIHPYPTNMAVLARANADALDVFDAETAVLEMQRDAAIQGYLWFDPESRTVPTVAMNAKLQAWIKEARSVGKLMHPDDLVESAHSFSHQAPLLVRRS